MPRPGLPKLIATDLDGTLVRSDDTVSAYTHEVLERVRAAGIRVVGATGRGPRLLDLTCRDIPTAEHLVLAGGGRVVALTDPVERVLLHDRRISGPMLAVLLERLEKIVGPLSVMVEVLDTPDAPLWGELHPEWPWPERVEPVPRSEALTGEVIKVFARAPDLDVDELVEVARTVIPATAATVTQAGHGFAEICPPGVDKASGLAVVAEALGVDRHEILVFGDMPNDVPMFEWAGWGRVAVANAHPAIRAMADEITLTNDEDGVAVWLDRLLSPSGVV